MTEQAAQNTCFLWPLLLASPRLFKGHLEVEEAILRHCLLMWTELEAVSLFPSTQHHGSTICGSHYPSSFSASLPRSTASALHAKVPNGVRKDIGTFLPTGEAVLNALLSAFL